jgi:hypothetical protein
MGKDLIEFFKACAALSDSRLNDPTYLAAKYVVWLAGQFNKHYDAEKVKFVKNKSPLEFLSVGVVMEDPDDIEYKYVIVKISMRRLSILLCDVFMAAKRLTQLQTKLKSVNVFS